MEQRGYRALRERQPSVTYMVALIFFWSGASAQIRYSISEELKEGTVVGNIAKDLGIDLSTLKERGLRIVSGSNEPLFQLNQDDGILYVTRKIDREEVCDRITVCLINLKTVLENPLEIHYVAVEASDKGPVPLTTDKSVIVKIIDVNDNAPEIEVTSFSKAIPEDSRPGTTVALISVNDLDSGLNGKVLCSVMEDLPFTLMSSLQDNMYSVVTKLPLDREKVSQYDLTIVATDQGHPPLSSVKTISVVVSDVNDNSPEFSLSPYTFYVTENNEPGASVFCVSASDRDIDENAFISYHILRDSGEENKWASFLNLNSENGNIVLPLDREKVSQYDLTIVATDQGHPPLSSVKTISVVVSDVNDNSPEFSLSPYTFYVTENNEPGASVFCVSASDRDIDENAFISYHILRDSGEENKWASFLNLNSENGNIVALKSFDFETLKTFKFQVVATDSGIPSLSSNVTVNVFILDQNDNAPVILYPVSTNGSECSYAGSWGE
uniref:Protocadherin 2 alpha a 15 n=1 Tax=Oncorhynchus tshawytscha TaxID=74940 RepID=A0AAZ3PDK7_ONCTS